MMMVFKESSCSCGNIFFLHNSNSTLQHFSHSAQMTYSGGVLVDLLPKNQV